MRSHCSHGWPIGRCDRCCTHGISLRSGCLVCSPDALSKRVSRDAEKARAVRIETLKDAVVEAAVAYAAWCKRGGPVTPEAEEQAVCTAVDDYFAAKEDS